MSFNMSRFLKILRSDGVLSSKQINTIKEAYNKASAKPPEFQVGDVFRSTQGVRLLAQLKDGKYVLVSLSSFHDHIHNVGSTVGGVMTLEQLEEYLIDHKYQICGRSETMVKNIPALKQSDIVDFDFETSGLDFLTAPPPVRPWRRGPRP